MNIQKYRKTFTDDTIKERTVQQCFQKFQFDDMNLENEPRGYVPSVLDINEH